MSADTALARPGGRRWRLPGATLPASILPAALLPAVALATSRVAAMGSQLAVQVAVGALSGPVGLGVLQLFTAWSTVLGEVLARGWPPTVMKQVAVAWSRSEPRTAKESLARAHAALRRLAFPAVLAAACLALLFSQPGMAAPDRFAPPLLIAVTVGAIAFALLRIGAEALKAMQAPLAAVTLESLAIPALLLGICGAFWLGEWALTPAALTLAGMGGFVLGALLIQRAVRRRLGSTHRTSAGEEADPDRRERRALWFGSVLAIAFLQLPFLVLPAFSDTATIGVFAVAYKLVNVITTLLLLMSSMFGPAFARASADGERDRLGALLRRTQWLSSALYAPAAMMLLATVPLLADLFHVPAAPLTEFIGLLVLGQAVNAVTGLSGVLLCLTGAARVEWRIGLATFVIACLSVYPVGQLLGAPGIAAWFSVVIALKNLASWAAARRHIHHGGLHP